MVLIKWIKYIKRDALLGPTKLFFFKDDFKEFDISFHEHDGQYSTDLIGISYD